MILSQTKIFNIFPGSLHTASVVQILSSYCNRYTYEYIPHRDLWLNRLYFEISNSSKKQCLTIDARDVNKLGPSKFRTGAENDKEQVSYFNYNKKDRVFNRFLAVRKRTPDGEIAFSIVSLINGSNNSEDIYYKLGDELSEFKHGKLQPKQRVRGAGKTDDRAKSISPFRDDRTSDKKQNRQISKKPIFLSG